MSLNARLLIKDKKVYEQYPYYYMARHYHKSHRNKSLEFQKGNYLWWIYLDDSRWMAIIKCTQSRISEYIIVRSVRRSSDGKMVMIVYPTERLRNQFIQARFNKSILYTPAYNSIEVVDTEGVKLKKPTDSVSLKQFGSGTIAMVGSESENAIVSFAADDIIVDERPLCNEMAIAMTPERQSDSKDRTTLLVGNPLIPDGDIDLDYQKTDQKVWSVKCSSCGKTIFPNFLDHVFIQRDDDTWTLRDSEWEPGLDRDVYPICNECGNPFDRFSTGEWVQKFPNIRDKSGYAISKIFCTNDSISQVVERFIEGLTNENKMQRVYNGDFGIGYIASDARLDSVILDRCIDKNYFMPTSLKDGCSVMGIDVGKVYNVVIRKVYNDKLIAIYINTIRNPGGQDKFKVIFELINRYRVLYAVIDSLPEEGLAKDFCANFNNGYRCYLGYEKVDKINYKTFVVNCNRTAMLDDVMSCFNENTFVNPANAKDIKDYYGQLKTPIRAFIDKGIIGKSRYIWSSRNKADHYYFAEAFCYLAYRIYQGLIVRYEDQEEEEEE